ncbi:MAG: hypothetical protein IJZ39_13660 [Oscillospiraceae bacterium]|nr:hypothetical protein [Oscillospiraceae bacterium]MBQ8239178.1 hypothetical protein [Oscillospiraceae bacterium]
MAKKKLPRFEFKPDPTGSDPMKIFHLTSLQRHRIVKWILYSALVLCALLLQDTMLSRIRLSGATTDLAVCAILLVGILEGPEEGGLFALLASLFYYCSGSAPGVYAIALVTAAAIFGALFRQGYWSQGMSSAVLCTGAALFAYELGLLLVGVFLNLTIWSRTGVFVLTALLSTLASIPLYPLARVIGQIGGEPWKE